jgi:hypothetical protein
LENLDEMDKLLDTNNLPKLNQEDINHINISTTRKQIQTLTKKSHKKKSQRPSVFTAGFCQTLKEVLIPNLLKLLHKI